MGINKTSLLVRLICGWCWFGLSLIGHLVGIMAILVIGVFGLFTDWLFGKD